MRSLDREYEAEDKAVYEKLIKPMLEHESEVTTLEVRTGRFGSKRSDAVMITASTGHILAPTWELVRAYRRRQIDQVEYRKRYIALLQTRWRQHKESFKQLVMDSNGSITLLCYCPAGQFCHRLIAAEVLVKVAKYFGVSTQYMGEV